MTNNDLYHIERKRFLTHLHYLEFLNTIPEDLKLSCNLSINHRIPCLPEIKKKTSLIKLTSKSLIYEQKLVHENEDYALMCVPWVAVKTYYLLFHQLLVLNYLITKDSKIFYSSHRNLLTWFNLNISNKSFEFSFKPLNNSYPITDALAFVSSVGANLKETNFSIHERFHQVLKKIANYKISEFKKFNRIEKVSKKSDQDLIKNFATTNSVYIFDFFWLYRIKSNYQDLDFLESMPSDDLVKFYCNYFTMTSKFSNALSICINKLSLVRFGNEIL
jgi:hypothetical protein